MNYKLQRSIIEMSENEAVKSYVLKAYKGRMEVLL